MIETPRLRLRPVRADDALDLHALYGDAESVQFISGLPLSFPDLQAKLLREIAEVARGEAVRLVPTTKEDDRAIGYAVMFKWRQRERSAEIGYMIARSHWGQGLVGEIVPALIHYGFAQMHLHRIEAHVDPRNAASIKLLEKNGFVREGQLRDSFLGADGKFSDSLIYGLLE